jgi:xanthine dehydrogenase accessory factor
MTFREFQLSLLRRRLTERRPVAVATITRIEGSSSRSLGARMIMTDRNEFVGSVSGGCVEGDVYAQAQPVLAGGPPRLARYRKVEDPILEVGLNCDGRIEVLIEPADAELADMLEAGPGTALITRYRVPDDAEDPTVEVERGIVARDAPAESRDYAATAVGGAPDPITASAAADDGALPTSPVPATGRVVTSREIERDGRRWVELIEEARGRELLLVFGADDVAFPLTRLARTLGYRVVVADPRSDYARPELFADADEVVCAWPDELPSALEAGGHGFGRHCAVVALNHEPKFEDALFRTLQEQPPVNYLGCMGKRRRHEERLSRAGESGVDFGALPAIHTPIGLDLGGRQPEEIALSIMAEVQAERYRRRDARRALSRQAVPTGLYERYPATGP